MSLWIKGSEIISLNPNAYVIDVIYFMKRNNIRRLVISDSSKIIGVFTIDIALKQILENKMEAKMNEIKLKKPVSVKSNDIKNIVTAMLTENSDFVIYTNKYIITERDIISNFNWEKIKEKNWEIARKAIVVEPFTKISTCAEKMLGNSIRHLPVVLDLPLGIVSARDIVYSFESMMSLNSNVEKIMNVNLVVGDAEDYVRDSVEMMLKRKVGSLIVKSKDNKKETLIFTNRDLIRLIDRYIR
ncbi:histidine kinase [Sulfolobus sp. A20]|uniref:CBS domain-containing protein n=1 Tax=Sulfolobaceae TaxID=118883 RepID=UPI000845D825|nr:MULTISPECIES: CBS domain-containing protein [unclassified Sulfolobus]TRM74849.1 CBS domain-containing protein [Sulfolobus sp. E5]TRM75628.1 CBS domain-containing protein [Sulfolobus sp. A20-N-F8]TRM79160.1 CBS domain-containing protein [Sulfolobus sp. B5]TRM82686.1 CBS domain-containing protein [Sulfolobus sp. F3]TRM87964.1 CBS domain-containing protein [Sulfolobus sp. E3]TRM89245.1 CBS domain-containing protein [Sulfolobus sp. C3]TRM97184.1 CBS domain-containing protein [Sulfolobus sp. E